MDMSAPITPNAATALGNQTIFPVDDFVKLPEFPFTKSSMRHLIFNSRSRFGAGGEEIPGNGLAESGAIIRIGRRILIDIVAFRNWIHSQRDQSPR